MKSASNVKGWPASHFPTSTEYTVTLLVTTLILAGCASNKPQGVVTRSGGKLSEATGLFQVGTVGLVCAREAAAIGFDKSNGRVDYLDDRAGVVARNVLATPVSPFPWVDAISGTAAFAVAPFAATGATIGAATRTLPPEKLSNCEQHVRESLSLMADQTQLKDRVLRVAEEKRVGQLIALDGNRNFPESADAVMETRIEDLHLEKTTRSDSSFALRIKARVRITQDRALVYDESFEYLSGTSLFIDWAMDQSLESVAETAYNELANNIVDRIFTQPSGGPILLGAGFKQPTSDHPDPEIQFAEVKRPVPERGTASGKPVFVDFRVADSASIGIYSTSLLSHITLQAPLTKDEAVIEALDDLSYDFDGLDAFPNIVVQLGVCAAAIPTSLYKQTAAAIQGVSAKKLRKANDQLKAAVLQTYPHEEVAREVAERLSRETAQTVRLVRKSLPPGDTRETGVMECVARGTVAWLPKNQTMANYLVSQGADSALEIQVTKASLSGEEGVNSPLALCLEAKALLYRSRDGRGVYSYPVKYRSKEHKFTAWAEHDAQLFREELANCYHEMGSAIANRLVSQRILAPPPRPTPSLVNN